MSKRVVLVLVLSVVVFVAAVVVACYAPAAPQQRAQSAMQEDIAGSSLTCILPTVVPVETVVLSPSGPNALPMDDTFLCQDRPTRNFGTVSTLKMDPNCTVLMRWSNLSRFRGKRVTGAKLRLFVIGRPVPLSFGSMFYTVYPVRFAPIAGTTRSVSWVELQSTWNVRVPGINWNLPGARGGTDTFQSLPSGYINVTSGWVETNLWLPLVQNWIDAPAENAGIAIMNQTAAVQALIASSEWYNRGFRPQLVLKFG